MMIKKAVEIVAQIHQLTPKEKEVLYFLSLGLDHSEIADMCNNSYATIRNHIKHIYEKTDTTHKGGALSKVIRVMES